MFKKTLAWLLALMMIIGMMPISVFAAETEIGDSNGIVESIETTVTGNVAKVGNTEYATIDEAIANWTNGTTLTLLADVTLSDVIKLSSTEHHILDLGTYTMTAASKKDAIQIVNNGRSSASYALDIKADNVTPGGITATGKAVVRTTGKSGVKDRPIIRFYGGVFSGSYVVYHSGSNGTNCPQFQFHGGIFNGTIYTNRSLNQFYGGTFTGSLQMSVDSSAYALIAGGTFAKLSNMMGSALNSGKFTIGSAKGVYDKEVYIDDNGNYVIAAAEPAQGIEAAVAKTPGTNDYLAYSKVATEGVLKYTDAKMALEKNNTTSAKVTVYADELDMAGINFKGTIVAPEGETLTIINAPEGLKTEGNVIIVAPVAQIGDVEYESLADALAAAKDGDTITLLADITLTGPVTITKEVTLDLNGKTLANYSNNKSAVLQVASELTLVDNSAEKTGKIVRSSESDDDCSAILVASGGTLILNSGSITSSHKGVQTGKGNNTVVINGGSIYGEKVALNLNKGTANVTINGGALACNWAKEWKNAIHAGDDAVVNVTIRDGDFTGYFTDVEVSELSITGGTFNVNPSAYVAAGYAAKKNADGYYVIINGLKGSGTQDDPYQINDLADLILFRDSVNAGETKYNAEGVYVVLTADIDLSSVANWAPIGTFDYSFDGNFNGQGHKIMNLKMSDTTAATGEAYLGFFGVTANNTIENFVIENVTINSNGQIVAAAIAYPYYSTVKDITVCGDIAIKGGNYTAGVLAYTRLCQNASNLTVSGKDGSYITGANVVGGVIADVQMNKGLVANYSNFKASNVTITGNKCVGGITGIIAQQTIDGATVENVTLVCSDSRVGVVAGSFGGTSTIKNIDASNVTGATAVIGGAYDGGAAVQAVVNDTYYATLEDALAATTAGDTITLLKDITLANDLTIDKDITLYKGDNVITGTLTLKAGTYDWDVTALCATGYDAYANGDGTWTVDLFSIYGANLDLGNSLDMNFFIEKSDLFDGQTYYVKIIKEYADDRADVVKIIPQSQWKTLGNAYYYVTFEEIAAKEMNDHISVIVYFDNGDTDYTNDAVASKEWIDSVRIYAERMLPKTTKAIEMTLYVDMLNYGAGAQEHFGYDNTDPTHKANAGIDAYQSYATQTIAYTNSQVKGDYYLGTRLVLENKTSLAFAFKASAIDKENYYAIATYIDHDGDYHEVRYEGSTFVDDGSIIYVYVDDLVVADGRSLVTCTIYDKQGEVITVAKDSIESYVARNSSYDFSLPLLKFIDAARIYVESKNK